MEANKLLQIVEETLSKAIPELRKVLEQAYTGENYQVLDRLQNLADEMKEASNSISPERRLESDINFNDFTFGDAFSDATKKKLDRYSTHFNGSKTSKNKSN